MGDLVRDIDDWMFHFERQVASGLEKLFSSDVGDLPARLEVRLQRLHDADMKVDEQAPMAAPYLR